MGAYDAGKFVLFLRSILSDLGIPQQAASIIYKDNDGATTMGNTQKPASRTRHMDVKYFALSDWVEMDLMILEHINTAANEVDHFTKFLDGSMFYRHTDHIMRRIPPPYLSCFDPVAWNAGIVGNKDVTMEDLAISPAAAMAARCEVSLPLWLDNVSHTMIDSNPTLVQPTLDCGGGGVSSTGYR